jgi:hypothetical protein
MAPIIMAMARALARAAGGEDKRCGVIEKAGMYRGMREDHAAPDHAELLHSQKKARTRRA